MPTIVHASLDVKLTKLTSYPESSVLAEHIIASCTKVKIQGAPPFALSKEDGYIETSQSAFLWDSASMPLALINNQEESRFDVWELESINSLKPVRKVSTNPLSSLSKNWISYSVVDVACVPEQRLLVAVNYYDPRPKIALYLYDTSNQNFRPFSEADKNALDLDKYFEQKDLNSGESIIIYYSQTKRKSAMLWFWGNAKLP